MTSALLLVVLPQICVALSGSCNRAPYGATIPKTLGDGGFRISISGNPGKYVPGEVYTGGLTDSIFQVENLFKN